MPEACYLAAREGAGCISLETMFLRKLVDLIHTKARQRLRPGGDRLNATIA